MIKILTNSLSATFTILRLASAMADVPESVAVLHETLVATVHAEGAQIYECKRDDRGRHVWQFREPIATLTIDGKTVGRHYAGPSWELSDGSTVTAKVVARAFPANPDAIPLLKLAVISQRNGGALSGVTTIQRLNTIGGVLEGACPTPGALTSVPYAADYTFLRRLD